MMTITVLLSTCLEPSSLLRSCVSTLPTLNGAMYKYNDTRFAQRWPSGPSAILLNNDILAVELSVYSMYHMRPTTFPSNYNVYSHSANHLGIGEVMLYVCDKMPPSRLHRAVKPSISSSREFSALDRCCFILICPFTMSLFRLPNQRRSFRWRSFPCLFLILNRLLTYNLPRNVHKEYTDD